MLAAAYGEIGVAPAGSRGRSVVTRAVARMAPAGERRTRRFVNGYQLSLDDAALATFGYDRETHERALIGGVL
jgi:hypothetical protein